MGGGGGFDPFFRYRCNQYNLVFHPPQQRGAKPFHPIHALAEANDDPRDASLCASKTAARLSWSWLPYIQPRKKPSSAPPEIVA